MPKKLWKPGQSGNPAGRPPNPEAQQLRDAIATVEKRKKKKWLITLVERSYDNDALAIAILKKLIPDLQHNDNTHGIDESTMALVVRAIEGRKKNG
jgi:hypothetical protein